MEESWHLRYTSLETPPISKHVLANSWKSVGTFDTHILKYLQFSHTLKQIRGRVSPPLIHFFETHSIPKHFKTNSWKSLGTFNTHLWKHLQFPNTFKQIRGRVLALLIHIFWNTSNFHTLLSKFVEKCWHLLYTSFETPSISKHLKANSWKNLSTFDIDLWKHLQFQNSFKQICERVLAPLIHIFTNTSNFLTF
jgi:hypothetical protein